MAVNIYSNFDGKKEFLLVNQGRVLIPDSVTISSVHNTIKYSSTVLSIASTVTIYGVPRSNGDDVVVLVANHPLNLPTTAGEAITTVIKIPKNNIKIHEIWWAIHANSYLDDIIHQSLQVSGSQIITTGKSGPVYVP